MRYVCLVLLAAGGCASNLPSFPYQTVAKPAPSTFTGAGRCRVRVEAPVFDEQTRWGGGSEADFVATLKPESRQSHEGDKPGTQEMFIKQIDINERDYIGKRGSVTTKPGGDEPYVLRARVLAVDTKSGALDVAYALLSTADQSRVGELRIQAGNVGFGLGSLMRNATIPHAWTILKYFADRFACNNPPRVVD